ncbi:MAG: terminase small subunit [Dehalococcoidia bacterium]|jgi:phage terminase small subunit|nr:terminase small subunit [Dehalococcoidia bacterium]
MAPRNIRLLTIKQECFAQEYVATGNACEAYRRAYDTIGNPNTVAREAHSLVTHPKVAPRIQARPQIW